IISRAEERQKLEGRSTYLLLDECHRWSKAQTDAILPAVEKGSIKFIGSTTENPLVAMTPAIVSRCRLFKFESLSKDNVREIILRAVKDKERGYGNMDVKITDEALEHIVSASGADARAALNALELAVLTTNPDSDGKIEITLEVAEESLQQKAMGVGDDEFYDMLSAFCKSLRGSDSDAALFWFARMILAGVDPMVIVRRIIAHASEDVGIADPNAMVQATAAYTALNAIGMPEARLSIAQAIIYVCEAPKSNSVCMAIDAAMREAKETYRTEVPLHLRDTHYAGSGRLGSGSGYKYPHNYEGHYVKQQYLPDGVQGGYYTPSEQGDEAEVGKRKEKRR
ncbi:MAG: replication-associated recombination protein A, partial [Christensenellaceae bacterium]